MTNDWHELLQASDAVQQSKTDSMMMLTTYTSAAGVQLSDLSGYRIFEIGGSDATTFLQGQFCNDITAVSSTQAQITGYCTPKGRLLALPIIVGLQKGYRLLIPEVVADAFIKRLSMFVMRADVSITELMDWVAVGITADNSGSVGEAASILDALPGGILSALSDEALDNPHQLIRWHDDFSGSVIKGVSSKEVDGAEDDGPVQQASRTRYLSLAPIARQTMLWNALEDQTRKHSQLSWRLADVSAGVPSITEGVVEAFVPQMINLHLIEGLSFTKGCYPGQEIVARMQYLGKLKRHMRLFSVAMDGMDIDSLLKPGQSISMGADESAGIIVDAMPCSSDMALVLAVTKVTSAQNSFALSEATLEACNMPYQLPSPGVA